MNLHIHLIASSIIALFLFPGYGWLSLFALAGFFIDIDHYFWYLFRKRDFNLHSAYLFYRESVLSKDYTDKEGALLMLHTVEFFALLVIGALYSDALAIALLGITFHYMLDLAEIVFVFRRFVVDHLLIHWLWKNLK